MSSLLTLILWMTALPNAMPRHYICYQSPSAPQIDGKAEAVWENVPWSESFVDIEGNDKPQPRLETRFKMLWDPSGLYLLAQLEEPHIQGSLTDRESVIFYDNDFEVFIDPDGDTHLYYEYEINALGTEWDLLLVKPYRDGGPAINAWDIEGVQSAVYCEGTLNDPSDEDRYWQVELFFPWTSLIECAPRRRLPRDGEQWRFNFSRVEWQWDVVDGQYQKRIDPQTGKAFPENNWVWSPQGQIAMHMPEHWGFVQFSTARPGEAPATFVPDPDWERKVYLRELYYAQRRYFEQHGQYASSLAALEITEALADWSLQMSLNPYQYEFSLTASAADGRWLINQEGKLSFRRS